MFKTLDRDILRIALPAIVTNITVPLLGLVDTAIVGHMGAAAYIGAVAVGTMIFSLVYWLFGFLRMGTSGLTAQARGRRDFGEVTRLLRLSIAVSLAVSFVLLLLQWPLRELMLWFISPTEDVRQWAVTYFNIVVWGAPPMLSLYGLTGWFIGMQNTRLPMVVSIVQNIVNILASLTLVYVLDMKVEGVALGTVIAQYVGLLTGVLLMWRYYGRLFRKYEQTRTKKYQWKAFLQVNRDIFIRTLFLVAVNLYFTSAGARQGAVILAVNTLLIQLYLLFSYIMDGFAYAGEALGGRYWGGENLVAFHKVVKRLFGWGAMMTLVFTLGYVTGGSRFLRLLTDESSVVNASIVYVWWAYLIPVAGVAAFVWDGIFIGMTQTRGMLVSSCLAAIGFFACSLLLMPLWGNHGLWAAMLLFLFLRGSTQTLIFYKTC